MSIEPGNGPLLGERSAFVAERVRARTLDWEERRFAWLRALEATPELARLVESVAAAVDTLDPVHREQLLTGPDWRRWLSRMVHLVSQPARRRQAMGTAVSVWNVVAFPWLVCGGTGRLELAVYRDGTVPLPGSGARLTESGEGRAVRLDAGSSELVFADGRGVVLRRDDRAVFLRAIETATVTPGIAFDRRLRRLAAVVGLADNVDPREVDGWIASIDEAVEQLDRRWEGGARLVRALARRLHLDGNREMYSKCTGELPGVVFLGRQRTDVLGIAELLVHECMHLLVYELQRLEPPLIAASDRLRRSPFSRVERPAYLVLHGTASFLVQTIATWRLGDDRTRDEVDAGAGRVRDGMEILTAHLAEVGAEPSAFVTALRGELEVLEGQLAGGRSA